MPLTVALERVHVRRRRRETLRVVRVAATTTRELLPSMTAGERAEWLKLATDRVARAKLPAKPRSSGNPQGDRGDTRTRESNMYRPVRDALHAPMNGHARGCRCPVCWEGRRER